MKELSILNIAKAVGATTNLQGTVNSVSTDSRKIANGCLFIALIGERFDAHDYVITALEKGAASCVVSKMVEGVDKEKLLVVKDTQQALQDLAEYYCSLFDVPRIAITGSVGKTTTKEMVYHVLSAKYYTVKNHGNLNNEVGLPLTVFEMNDDTQAVVLEMGMAGKGEIAQLSKIVRPSAAILTNIGVSHLEALGTQENILKEKMSITDYMKKDAPVLLNGDDKFLKKTDTYGHPAEYFGITSENLDYWANEIRTDEIALNIEFMAHTPKGSVQVTLPTIGIHNVYNALAAIWAGIQVGISLNDCAKALGHYIPAGMRQNIVHHKGLTVIEDCYNASPDSMSAALSVLSEVPALRRIAVLGDMLELGVNSKAMHEEVGKTVASLNIDMLFTLGENAQYLGKSASKHGVKHVESFMTQDELVAKLMTTLQEKDTVLFKGSNGMKLDDVVYKIYEGWE